MLLERARLASLAAIGVRKQRRGGSGALAVARAGSTSRAPSAAASSATPPPYPPTSAPRQALRLSGGGSVSGSDDLASTEATARSAAPRTVTRATTRSCGYAESRSTWVRRWGGRARSATTASIRGVNLFFSELWWTRRRLNRLVGALSPLHREMPLGGEMSQHHHVMFLCRLVEMFCPHPPLCHHQGSIHRCHHQGSAFLSHPGSGFQSHQGPQQCPLRAKKIDYHPSCVGF